MKKKILSVVLLSLLAVSLVSAGLVTYYGRKTTDIEVAQAITMPDCSESLTAFGGETVTTGQCTATSQTSVDIPIEIVTTGTDAGIDSLEVQYELYAEGTEPREDRIRVEASNIEGVTTLDDIDTISWQQNVETGYISHVDVRLEDKTLVFEYAKVAPPCDNAPYPTGEQNTFGDKGIVDSDAMAWISSGPAGPCGDATFDAGHKSLNDWKTSDGPKEVIALEFEVDSWIAESTAKISELKVNDVSVGVITAQAGLDLVFDLIIDFADGAEGSYTLVTDIEVQ